MRKLMLLLFIPVKYVCRWCLSLSDHLRVKLVRMLHEIFLFFMRNFLKIGLLSVALFFMMENNVDLQFQFNSRDIIPNSAEQLSFGNTLGNFLDFNKSEKITATPTSASIPKTDWGNTYSNMTYGKKATSTQLKREKQQAYVNRFKDVARSEMHKFGIPASITLAQGILESGSGKGTLAVKANNHFGIKCHKQAMPQIENMLKSLSISLRS